MSMLSALPIMPKEIRSGGHPRGQRSSVPIAPYPASSSMDLSNTPSNQQRSAAIWSTADDEVLLHARAMGMNWQPIAAQHFPNKTPNACRKRHERLIERRQVEEWDHRKLELLAEEYLACRKQMWEILAARVGERWAVVEAKCMEKGLKSLQITARTAHRKASAVNQHCSGVGSFDSQSDGGISDRHSDSGIGFGSEAEMEIGEEYSTRGRPVAHLSNYHEGHIMPAYQPSRSSSHEVIPPPSTGDSYLKSASWHAPGEQYTRDTYVEHARLYPSHSADHIRTRSLPQPLPLYQPPPPLNTQHRRAILDSDMLVSPQEDPYLTQVNSATRSTVNRCSPESTGRSGFSIQSVLSG